MAAAMAAEIDARRASIRADRSSTPPSFSVPRRGMHSLSRGKATSPFVLPGAFVDSSASPPRHLRPVLRPSSTARALHRPSKPCGPLPRSLPPSLALDERRLARRSRRESRPAASPSCCLVTATIIIVGGGGGGPVRRGLASASYMRKAKGLQ